MKSIFYKLLKNLTLFSVLLGFIFLISCEDENAAESSKIELLSFGPSGVQHGDVIQFIGTNMDKVTAIVFADGTEVSSGEFQSKSQTVIEIVVPSSAESGNITLKTPQGDIVSKTIINFDVPVVISSITAEAKPGTEITITGELLNWVESVTFTSDLMVEMDDFVSQSQTELVVTVPLEARTGFLTFASGGTEPMTFLSDDELIVTLPTVSSLDPSSIRHESDLSIIGTDLHLITEVILTEGVSVDAMDFVSQSETEIVLKVPATTESGVLLLKQHSPVDITTTDELLIILPVGSSVDPSPAIPGEDDITISGTDLDLVSSLSFSPGIEVSSGSFISHTDTDIVLAVPADAKQGGISYTTIHGYSNALGVALILPGDGPAPLLVPVYEEGLEPTVGEGGGWNTTTDFNNTENPRLGTLSVKVSFNGSWGGGGQFGTWGKPDLDVSSSEVFIFSVYGGAGTDGAGLNVGLNGNAAVAVTISEGEWMDFEIPLADWGGFTNITEIWFQDQGFTGDIYIDHIGFGLPSGPAALTEVIYEDEVDPGWQLWGGWGAGSSDITSTENVRSGDKSSKTIFGGDWGGALQFGGGTTSTAGLSVFAFSIYGDTGTDGQELNVILKGGSNEEIQVTIVEGEWTDFEIDLADFGDPATVTELFFQDRGWSGTIHIDHIGFR